MFNRIDDAWKKIIVHQNWEFRCIAENNMCKIVKDDPSSQNKAWWDEATEKKTTTMEWDVWWLFLLKWAPKKTETMRLTYDNGPTRYGNTANVRGPPNHAHTSALRTQATTPTELPICYPTSHLPIIWIFFSYFTISLSMLCILVRGTMIYLAQKESLWFRTT